MFCCQILKMLMCLGLAAILNSPSIGMATLQNGCCKKLFLLNMVAVTPLSCSLTTSVTWTSLPCVPRRIPGVLYKKHREWPNNWVWEGEGKRNCSFLISCHIVIMGDFKVQLQGKSFIMSYHVFFITALRNLHSRWYLKLMHELKLQ